MINVNVKNYLDSHQKMASVLTLVGNQHPSPFRNSGEGSTTRESLSPKGYDRSYRAQVSSKWGVSNNINFNFNRNF